jgi:hypothetical protein
MKGTALGNWIARAYAERLRALKAEDMPENSEWRRDDNAWVCYECATDRILKDLEPREARTEKWGDPRPECPDCKQPMEWNRQAGERVNLGRYFYGLTFHDPDYDPAKAVIGKDCLDRTIGKGAEGKTVAQAEEDGVSFGLERYQAVYKASAKQASARHRIPSIDGACGFSSVEKIMEAIGLSLEYVPVKSRKLDVYTLHDKVAVAA